MKGARPLSHDDIRKVAAAFEGTFAVRKQLREPRRVRRYDGGRVVFSNVLPATGTGLRVQIDEDGRVSRVFCRDSEVDCDGCLARTALCGQNRYFRHSRFRCSRGGR